LILILNFRIFIIKKNIISTFLSIEEIIISTFLSIKELFTMLYKVKILKIYYLLKNKSEKIKNFLKKLKLKKKKKYNIYDNIY